MVMLEDLQRFARVRDWKRGTFGRVMHTGERASVRGLVHSSDEYAIEHSTSRRNAPWNVTHLFSGHLIGSFDDKELAMAFVQQVRELYPSFSQVSEDTVTREDMLRIRAVAAGWVCFHGGETLSDFRAWVKSER